MRCVCVRLLLLRRSAALRFPSRSLSLIHVRAHCLFPAIAWRLQRYSGALWVGISEACRACVSNGLREGGLFPNPNPWGGQYHLARRAQTARVAPEHSAFRDEGCREDPPPSDARLPHLRV
jgi:hypothetical protein